MSEVEAAISELQRHRDALYDQARALHAALARDLARLDAAIAALRVDVPAPTPAEDQPRPPPPPVPGRLHYLRRLKQSRESSTVPH